MDSHEKTYWALKAMRAIFSGTSWATKRSSVAKTKQYIKNYRSPYSKTFLAECIEKLLIEMSKDLNKIKEWGFTVEEFVYTLYYLSVSIDDTLTEKLEVIGKLELNKKNQVAFFQIPGREIVVNETLAEKHKRKKTSHISQISTYKKRKLDQMKRGVLPNQVVNQNNSDSEEVSQESDMEYDTPVHHNAVLPNKARKIQDVKKEKKQENSFGLLMREIKPEPIEMDLEEMMAFTEKDISLLAKLKESKPHKPAATIAEALANIISTGAQSDDVEIANKNDYTKFVTKSNAILWEDDFIQIGCKLETCRNLGRLEMFYGNKTSQPFNKFTPIITCPGALASQLQARAEPVEPVVAAETQIQQLIDLVCVREFQKMPIMNVKFSFTDRAGALQNFDKNFYLPLFISKFIEPTNMTSEKFFNRWESLNAPSQEAQKIFNAQSPMKTANIETTLKGFGVNLLTDGGLNPGNYKCAGIIHTQTQQIGILIRLETNKQSKMLHLTIRSSKDTVVQTLVDLLANQL